MTKKLTSQDEELWKTFTKGVRQIKCNKVCVDSPKIIKTPEYPRLPTPHVKSTQKVAQLHANELRTLKIDGQIDLHGFTQFSGELALREFLKTAVYKDWRWVRIITGKGSPNNPSILREQTPKWLKTMPEFVTGYTFAAPDDGGTGAFYIKIRRKLHHK